MANEVLIDIFDTCLTRMADGETIDNCVQSFPDFANELRPMLEATNVVRRAQAPLDEVARSRQRVRLQFEQALHQPTRVRRYYPMQRVASVVLLILFVGSLLITGAVVAAQDTIPGDTLYPVKRWTEQVQLVFASDKAALEGRFARRRLEETRQVIDLGREVEVEFSGSVERISDTAIQVADFEVVLSDALRTVDLLEGMQVKIIAHNHPRQPLLATTLDIIDRPEPAPVTDTTLTPTATSTPVEPTVADTATRPPTQTPRPTATPSMTQTRHRTATPHPSRTSSPEVIEPKTEPMSRGSTPTSEDCVVSPPDGWVRYTVQPGDTPSGIAVGTEISVRDFYEVNCNLDPRILVAGAVVYVPYEPRLLESPTPAQRTAVPQMTGIREPVEQSSDNTNRRRPTTTPNRENNNDDDDEGNQTRQRQRESNDGDQEQNRRGR